MALEQHSREATANAESQPRPPSLWQRLTAGGAEGNAELTTATGALLFVLIAALGLTILAIHSLIYEHLFLGVLLLGPVTLKLASVGYRFARYFSGNPRYRERPLPDLVMRALAPFLVLATLVVFASGVVLLFAGPGSSATWNPIHKYSFIAWLAIWSCHVILHLPDLPKLWQARARQRERPWDDLGSGRGGRAVSIASALVGGLLIAILTIPLFAAWSGR